MTVEREGKLIKIVCAIGRGGALGLTRTEIGKALGLKKSPYLLQLIDTVEHEGYTVKEMFQNCYPPRYVYYPTQKALDFLKDHDHA